MLDQVQQYNLVFPKELIKNIYVLKNKNRPILRSNRLGWQSPQYENTNDIKWINNFLSECMTISNITELPNQIWFNISPKNAYHDWHSHGRYNRIGVFYIQIPENSGNIEFKDNDTIYSITPYEGLLLIAPGGVEHRVLSNNSDQDRISMAFNLSN